MRRFHFEANALFYAENIDDAFKKLSQHFAALAEDNRPVAILFEAPPNDNHLEFVGEMNINPIGPAVTEVMKDPAFREIED